MHSSKIFLIGESRLVFSGIKGDGTEDETSKKFTNFVGNVHRFSIKEVSVYSI